MAFYAGKVCRSARFVPATKSLGFSTRTHEGDKTKEDGSYTKSEKHAQVSPNVPVESLDSTSPAIASSLPLSVRDMALVLLPRLKADQQHQLRPDSSIDSLMNVAKSISFTSDDILSESFNSCHFNNSSIFERSIVDLQHKSGKKLLNNSDNPLFIPAQLDSFGRLSSGSVDCGGNFETFCSLSNAKFSQFDSNSFHYCSSGKGGGGKNGKKSKDGPSAEQLHSIRGQLENLVQLTFGSRYDYSLLHKDIVFENHLFGENRVKRGHTSYALELLYLRLRIHARYSSTSMEVLNSTVHEDTGVIRVHWRLKGLPQMEILKFWRLFQAREEISKDDWQWFEAFSYFHIGKDGLVHKHKIDRMLPGGNEPDKLSVKLRKLLDPAKPLVN